MKAIFTILMLSITVAANAAMVLSAQYDKKSDEIVAAVKYGGCNLETFKPVWGKCLETFPMQTTVTLQDDEDNCEAIKIAKVRIPANDGCRPAYVNVRTGRNSRSNVTVLMPEQTE